MTIANIEQVRRDFGGFAELIRNDAEDYVSFLLGEDSGRCTTIFLGMTDGTPEDGSKALRCVEEATQHLEEYGFQRPESTRCTQQIGFGDDFVYACSIDTDETVDDYRQILELVGAIQFRSAVSYQWRVGIGVDRHTAYVALSHAKANQLWADNLIGGMIEDSGKSLESVEHIFWNTAIA